MKNTSRFGWLATITLLAAACSKSNNDPTLQKPQPLELKTVVDGRYWSSRSSFRYLKNGVEEVDPISTLSSLYAEYVGFIEPRFFLGVFYPSGNSIDKYTVTPYTGDSKGEKLQVCRGLYTIRIDSERNVIKLTANDPAVAEHSIYTDAELRLISLAEDRIEFDLKINDYVRNAWAPFFDRVEAPLTFTGIREVWTPVTEQQKIEYKYFENPTVVFP